MGFIIVFVLISLGCILGIVANWDHSDGVGSMGGLLAYFFLLVICLLVLIKLFIPDYRFDREKVTFIRPAPIEYYKATGTEIKFIVNNKLYIKKDLRYLNTNNIVEKVEYYKDKTNVSVILIGDNKW